MEWSRKLLLLHIHYKSKNTRKIIMKNIFMKITFNR